MYIYNIVNVDLFALNLIVFVDKIHLSDVCWICSRNHYIVYYNNKNNSNCLSPL